MYIGIVVYSGWRDVGRALGEFPWIYAPLVFALAFFNYIFRFLKWDFYLRTLEIECPRKDSAVVFFSGLAMVITPGKIGELLKSWLLKKTAGIELSRSMPVVIAERLTDFIALVIISLAGVSYLATGDYMILLVVGAVLASFVLVISNRRISLGIIEIIEKIPAVARFGHRLRTMYDSMSRLLRLKPLVIATSWSVASWMCECLGLYIVMRLLGGGASLPVASFIYAFGTIVGAVAPGGLGVTDSSLIAMLQNNALMGGLVLTKAGAGAATMIIRMATLWFAVLVGALVLLKFQKRFAGAEELMDGHAPTGD